MENEIKTVKLDSIQFLRGIAALLVMSEHIGFLQCGAFGVDIFFVISGFIIMYTTQDSIKNFWKKRIVRIVPLYWGMTLLLYMTLVIKPNLFEQTHTNLEYLLKSLFFIPFMQEGVMQPIVRVGWSINYEIFFYLIFGISSIVCKKYRGLLTGAIYIFLVFGCGLIPYKSDVFAFFCNPIQLEFILGIVCFYIVKWLSVCSIPKWGSYIAMFGGIAGCIWLMLTRKVISLEVLGRFTHWGISAMMIFLLFFIGGRNVKMPKLLILIGDMSYSIYLIHYYVFRMVEKTVCDMTTISMKSVLSAVVSVFAAMGVSFISWAIIENKFTKWIRMVARI